MQVLDITGKDSPNGRTVINSLFFILLLLLLLLLLLVVVLRFRGSTLVLPRLYRLLYFSVTGYIPTYFVQVILGNIVVSLISWSPLLGSIQRSTGQ